MPVDIHDIETRLWDAADEHQHRLPLRFRRTRQEEEQGIRRTFCELFRPRIALPERQPGAPERGEFRQERYYVRYLWGSQDGELYLDYYARHEMARDLHVRIWGQGGVQQLPAITNIPARPSRRTREECWRRFQERHPEAAAVLRAKGFA